MFSVCEIINRGCRKGLYVYLKKEFILTQLTPLSFVKKQDYFFINKYDHLLASRSFDYKYNITEV